MAAMAAKTMAAGKNESTAVQKNGLAVNSHFSVVQVRQTPRAAGRWGRALGHADRHPGVQPSPYRPVAAV